MKQARFAVIASIAAAGFAPADAAAIPVLGAPTPESVADSRPLLSWSLVPGEEVNTLSVASSADRTPEGEFFDENRITGDAFSDGTTTQWQPTSRISAGEYWWNLQWYVSDYSFVGYTDPASFTIPVQLRSPRLAIRQYLYSADEVTLSFVTNASRATVTCAVFSGRRRIARRVIRFEISAIGARSSTTCDVGISRRWAGKRLRVVAEARAAEKTVRQQRIITGRRR